MKKYKFRLESLLKYRAQKEDLLMHQLSKCQKVVNLIQKNIHDLTKEKNDHIQEFENELHQSPKIHQITSFYSYLERVDVELIHLDEKLHQANIELERIIEKLKIANKDKKVLDKLKEKHFEEYKRDLNLEEYKTNDQRNSFNHYVENLK